jgi:myo-inositol 2-dehydrogenase/D-chiro-inositol 1-dehydrogenase
MAVFRLGLLGAGRMGQTHLRALANSDRVRIVAVAEPSVEQRQHLSHLALPVYVDLGAMLDAGGIDGALIAAPTVFHLDVVRRVLARGLPVLCEKPCGAAPSEAADAAKAAASAGLPLQIAYWRRFVPALRHTRQRIVNGEFGQLYLVTCYQWDEQAPPASFRAHSGGIFIDMGVHEFDQLRWLTGQEITEIYAAAASISHDEPVPGDAESAQVLCRLSGGSTGIVSLGRRFPAGDVCWAQIFGTRDAEACRFLWPPDAEATFLHALRLQAESFARFAGGAATEGAQASDAVAALTAAAKASQVLQTKA